MSPRLKTIVTFKSNAFNTSESRDYFVNPGCYGDDVARWMIGELDKRGISTIGEPAQEDFGWYFTFRVDDAEYEFDSRSLVHFATDPRRAVAREGALRWRF